MKLKEPAPKRSLLTNIGDALRLSWQASPWGCALIVGVLPVVEGLLLLGLLVMFRAGAGQFLDAAHDPVAAVRELVPFLTAAVLVTLVMLTLNNARQMFQEILLDRVRQLAARRIHRSIASLELIDFDDPVVHDRVSRAETTADTKPRQVIRGLAGLIASAVQILAFTLLLVVLQPLLLPLMALAAAPILFVSARMAGDRFQFFRMMTPLERERRYVGRLITGREAAGEVRAFGLNEHLAEKYQELSAERHEELSRSIHRQWRRSVVGQVAFGLIMCATAGILAWLFVSGRVDVATLLTTIIALSRLASAIGGLGGPITELSEASLYLGDQQAFHAQAEQAQAEQAEAGSEGRFAPGPLRAIEVSDLSFTYPKADRPALDGVDLRIEAGQLVAFVGPNGSGKTTLAKLISFLYTPSDGAVRWNGVDATALDADRLRDRVSSVFQDHMTYHFSVTENVTLGDVGREPEPGEVRAALAAAGALPSVERLPDGVDTAIGPEFGSGTNLSGGELQRLAIARALYRGRDLLVLDEPTSALDARSDRLLLNELPAVLGGRTCVLVSHRFSNVRQADQIFVFDGGRVVERGTHEELMAEHGLYAEMYALQASAFAEEQQPLGAEK